MRITEPVVLIPARDSYAVAFALECYSSNNGGPTRRMRELIAELRLNALAFVSGSQAPRDTPNNGSTELPLPPRDVTIDGVTWLNTEQAAAELDLTDRQVRNLCTSRQLGTRLGKRWAIHIDDINAHKAMRRSYP